MQINQFVSNYCLSDAISNNVRYIKNRLNSLEIDSEIYTQYPDQFLQNECKIFNTYSGNPENILIMHASTWSEMHSYIAKLPDKKAVLYHNITPSNFFEGFSDFFVSHLNKGRAQLKSLPDIYDLAFSVSDFNSKELREIGFSNVFKVPLFFDFEKLKNAKLLNTISSKYLDPKIANILFVGRFAPNKKHEDIIKAFFFYRKYFNLNSRLILIGDYKGQENYYSKLLKLIEMLDIKDFVDLPGKVKDEELFAFYKHSDLFLSMSEHEGFFAPILESYYFDLPVLVYDAGAVSETMNGGGVLFEKKDFDLIAGLMNKLILDNPFRLEILQKQKSALFDFMSSNDDFKLFQILKEKFPNLF